ncbi:MAG: hypothetical protein Q9220_007392 [cf. Caloplaca sp. 1 TL-2023]
MVYVHLLMLLAVLSSTYAKLSDVARQGGYTKRTIDDMRKRKLNERAMNSTGLRYYNNATKDYFVESLPEVPQNLLTEMYSGLVPIDLANTSRALFYVFQPTVGPPVDEVTIWMNGGPGCSSLEGFLQENGLIQWTWGQFNPTINDYSWVNLTNMLWVEQPVGTGFSIGDATATSEEDIAADFISFFKNFQDIFGIQNYKIYVTGESYAGRYVPYVANAMLDQNDTCYYDVNGILVYDPCIGSYAAQNDITTYPFVEHNNNVLNLNQSFLADMAAYDKSCGYADFREQYMSFPPNGTQPPLYENCTASPECCTWNSFYYAAYDPNPCFNVYEIGLQCPLLGDVLGYPTDLQYVYDAQPVYFNRTDVKVAMHAPLDVEWLECAPNPVFVGDGGPEDEGDSSADPIQKVLPRVIEATNRVLVANGDLDADILTNATLLAIQNMTWNGLMGFQSEPATPIDITLPDLQYQDTFTASGFDGLDSHQGIMGVQHYERGLMWAETYLSGHMEPQFQPRSAYRHLQWVLGRIDAL